MPIGGVPAPTHWQETCLDIHMWLISNWFLFAQTLLQMTRRLKSKPSLQNIFNSSNKNPHKDFFLQNHYYKHTLIYFNSFPPPRFHWETMTKRAEHQEKCHTVPLNAETNTLRTSWVWHPPSSALIGRGPLPLSFPIGCWYPRAGRRGLYK